MRRHVNHLQPAKIAAESSHMKTHRGHSAGVNSRTAIGKTINGPQPRHTEICAGEVPRDDAVCDRRLTQGISCQQGCWTAY